MSQQGVIKVRLIRNGKNIRSYKVRSDVVTIGSEKGCSIRAIGDESVQTKHASLYVEGEELTLVPEPGAVVSINGEDVDFAVVRPSDIIQVGKLTFSVERATHWDTIPPGVEERQASEPHDDRQAAQPSQDKRRLPPFFSEKAPLPPLDRESVPASLHKKAGPSSLPRPVSMRRRSSFPPAPAMSAGAEIVSSFGPSEPTPAPWISGIDEIPPLSEGRSDSPSSILGLGDDVTNSWEKETVRRANIPSSLRESKEPFKEAESQTVRSWADPAPDYYFYDENEEEGGDFREPFDLAGEILQRKLVATQGPRAPYCAAHVVRIVEGKVVETFGVLPGRRFIALNKELECCVRNKKLLVRARQGLTGDVYRAGVPQEISSFPKKRKKHVAELGQGDFGLLYGQEGTYKIEVYRPALVPKPRSIKAERGFLVLMLFALVFHLVVVAAIGIMRPADLNLDEETQEEVFAEVKFDSPEVKKPETKPESLPQKVKRDAVAMAEKAPKVSRRAISRISDRAKEPPRNTSVGSLLKVLSKGSGKAGAGENLKDLVSNIDAVATSGRSGSPFQIAGAIASLPGAGVNIARKGGGGIISTLSGDDVAGKGSKVAKLSGGKGGKVRGKVTKMSSGARVKGSLSREEVSRVVNSHIHAIQACYERALMNNPGMSGRIVFDWVVTKSGRVKGVRVRSSTLGSAGVASCINKLIKRWKFPPPKGGDVTITYPFLFRSVQS